MCGRVYRKHDTMLLVRIFCEFSLSVFSKGKQFELSRPPENIAVNDVITFRCTSFSDKVPQDAGFVKVRTDLRRGDIEPLPYRLSYGKQRGVPRCRACKKDFRERNELRITVSAMFHPPGVGPYTGMF